MNDGELRQAFHALADGLLADDFPDRVLAALPERRAARSTLRAPALVGLAAVGLLAVLVLSRPEGVADDPAPTAQPTPAPAPVTDFAPDVHVEAPDGPAVLLGGGQLPGLLWEVVAYRASSRAGGVCTWLEMEGFGGGGGCGFVPSDGVVFGPHAATPGPAGRVIVHAVLSAEVRRVWIETDGEAVEADVLSLANLDLDASGFAVALPPGITPMALVALDAGGAVLGRSELLPVEQEPAGPPSPMPTPASP